MIKSQLVKRLLQKNPHLIQRDIEKITSLIIENIKSSLASEDRVEIRGFGSFSVRHRKSKNGRNPKTGESVHVPAKKVAMFKPGKGLRDRLNFKP
tara:strand:- start:486 stop:770 length:285 start_codon:yes stop_codon:yes gene_type:complete